MQIADTKNIFQSKIGRKLAVAIVLFSSIVTLLITVFQIYMDYQYELDEISRYLNQIETSYLPSLTKSLWIYDDGQVDAQLNGILSLPGMEFVEIEENGNAQWSVGSRTSKYTFTKDFQLIYHDDDKPILLGKLGTTNSLDKVYKRLFGKAITIIISNGIKTFLVACFMLFLFHILVTRHLLDLSLRLRLFRLDNNRDMPLPDMLAHEDKYSDEIEQIRVSVSAMQERILKDQDFLQKSEQKYRLLISKMSAGFALHEIILNQADRPVDYRFLDVNSSFEKLTGLKKNNIIGKTVREILPKTEEYWIENFGQVALSGESRQYENYSKELGKFYDVIAYSHQEKLFATIISDVTERKKAQETLDSIFNLAPDMIGVANVKKGYFSQVNPAWEAVLGRPAEDILSRPYMDFIHPDDHQKTTNGEITLESGKSLSKFENRYRCKDGSYKYLEWHSTEAQADGTVYAIARDITERKQTEGELEMYHEKLEQLVDERTKDLKKTINLMSGRENRMADLKKENMKLQEQINNVDASGGNQ